MTSFYYVASQNTYLGKFGIYTQEEIDYVDSLESKWKKTQQNYSLYQLLEIFPQARAAAKRALINEIKQCRRNLEEARRLYNEYTYKIIPQTQEQSQWFIFLCREINAVSLQKECERLIKRNCFYLSALKTTPALTENGDIRPQDVQQAKDVPLDTFLKINKAGFARCPFHEDKTPSLKVYKNVNRWWCYSENIGGDVIDLYKKLHNCDFITAVKKLVNK